MNRQSLLTLLATFALLFCFTYSCNAKGKDKAKHVVFIGLDGWGAYSLPKADMPNVKQLMENGSYTLETFRTSFVQRHQLGIHVYGSRSGTARIHRMGIQNSGTSVTCIK